MYCFRNHEVIVCRSAAGYYIGTYVFSDDCGCMVPNCRLSADYWETADEAQLALNKGTWRARCCVENSMCSAGNNCLNHL